MDLDTRFCCDYDYANNMPKLDCYASEEDKQSLMNHHTEVVNKYKPENIDRNKLIDLFDNNENDEIKKLLSMSWEWYGMNELLFEYCIDRNDIDFLERIISKNNDTDLFAIRDDKFVQLLINMDRYDMCKFILDHMQLSPETIDDFLKYIVREQKINYLDLFMAYNHKMLHTHLMMAIVYNCMDVVTYAIVNGCEVQIAFDNCAFYNYQKHDISCDTLISMPMLELLVDYQIDIFKKISWLSLHAAKYGSLELIEYCYKHDVTIDVNTGLIVACRNSNVNIAKYTLELGANINIISDITIKNTSFAIVKLCLHHGIKLSTDSINEMFSKFFICEEIQELQILISHGADPNYIFESENKSEYYFDIFQTIQYMTSKKYDLLNSKLEYITSMGKISHIKFLVDMCFDKLEPELNRLFVIGCANGQIDMVNYLLDLGADIHTGDNLAFASACFFGHLHIVQLLLDKGVVINTITVDLIMLVVYGYIPEKRRLGYRQLITKNIFRNDLFNIGISHLDIFKLLMSHDIPVLNLDIFSILPKAYHTKDIFTYLLSHYTDSNLDKILEHNVYLKNITIVKFLLDHGANPDCIISNTNDKINELLLEYKSK